MKTSFTITTIALGFTLAAGTSWAGDVDLSKLPPVSNQTGVTYAKDIQPIFQSTCFRCHGEDRQKGDLRLDSLEAALKGGKDGKMIIPGKSQESRLVIAVARLDDKTAMPPVFKHGPPAGGPPAGGPPGAFGAGPGGRPADSSPGGGFTPPGGPGSPDGPGGGMPSKPKSLTPQQVGLIRAWIDQGAN